MLNKKQKAALRELTQFRHKLHSREVNFRDGRQFIQTTRLLGIGQPSEINSKLKGAGLSPIAVLDELIPKDADTFVLGDTSSRFDSDLHLEQFLEDMNTIIENYLSGIDKQHGTKYTPSKFARMLWDARDSYIDKKR